MCDKYYLPPIRHTIYLKDSMHVFGYLVECQIVSKRRFVLINKNVDTIIITIFCYHTRPVRRAIRPSVNTIASEAVHKNYHSTRVLVSNEM